MIQGTGSHVGKSTLVAGLCRALVGRGINVAPFKPQNMSNNAAVAADGGEIGRAQALQARAARLLPSVHMNPVLLKPESETGAQVIVQGRRFATLRAAEYGRRKAELMPFVMDSFARVAADADFVLVEGAGSPAEVNLRSGDIANMGFAEAADVPVVLVADIDRGGVIASVVGTHAVLSPGDRAHVRGFIINKMRGDAGLFADGLRLIVDRTGWRCLGVVPWLEDVRGLPEEDSVALHVAPLAGDGERTEKTVLIGVPQLPRIANFDDLDPLRSESGVSVVMVEPGRPFPDCDLILIPGSKATIADLAFLRQQAWDIDIVAHQRRGGRVLGICGGYQMLGRSIADPAGVEGPPGMVAGLGLLDVETVLSAGKTTVSVAGRDPASGASVGGYEIHLGETTGRDTQRPFLDLGGHLDGARSADGRVAGTYVHGLFAADAFRRAFLSLPDSGVAYEAGVEAALDALAAHVEAHVDVDALLAIARYTSQSATETSATSANRAALAAR
ncbi:MAG TPA: cobyric acid synthase [Bauldia sp.]|nr:cobyric acid synthase [Bauldia sp.]